MVPLKLPHEVFPFCNTVSAMMYGFNRALVTFSSHLLEITIPDFGLASRWIWWVLPFVVGSVVARLIPLWFTWFSLVGTKSLALCFLDLQRDLLRGKIGCMKLMSSILSLCFSLPFGNPCTNARSKPYPSVQSIDRCCIWSKLWKDFANQDSPGLSCSWFRMPCLPGP